MRTETLQRLLLSGRRLRFEVLSNSMNPLFSAGDAVWVLPCARLMPGAVVVFRQQTDWVVHRLIVSQPARLITRGDAQMWPDPPCPPEAVVGCVVEVERAGRRLDLTARRWQRFHGLLGRWSRWQWRAQRAVSLLPGGRWLAALLFRLWRASLRGIVALWLLGERGWRHPEMERS